MEAQRRRGRHEKVLRQAVIGMIAGARLGEHQNPGEAQAWSCMGTYDSQQRAVVGGHSGDLLIMPDNRHSLEALGDSVVLLMAAKLS
jgi:quercetin dioxygenase-like cupin family protein